MAVVDLFQIGKFIFSHLYRFVECYNTKTGKKIGFSDDLYVDRQIVQ